MHGTTTPSSLQHISHQQHTQRHAWAQGALGGLLGTRPRSAPQSHREHQIWLAEAPGTALAPREGDWAAQVVAATPPPHLALCWIGGVLVIWGGCGMAGLL